MSLHPGIKRQHAASQRAGLVFQPGKHPPPGPSGTRRLIAHQVVDDSDHVVALGVGVAGPDDLEHAVLLHHVERAQFGLEFYDMPTPDFAVLAGAIEQFHRLRRRSKVSP